MGRVHYLAENPRAGRAASPQDFQDIALALDVDNIVTPEFSRRSIPETDRLMVISTVRNHIRRHNPASGSSQGKFRQTREFFNVRRSVVMAR